MRGEHRLGAVETAHQRLLQELEVAVVAAGELGPDWSTAARSPSSAAARPRVSSKRSGFRLCGMMLRARRQLGREHQVAELLGAVQDHVLREPRRGRVPAARTRTAPRPRACPARPAPWRRSGRARRSRAPSPRSRAGAAAARRSPRRCRAASDPPGPTAARAIRPCRAVPRRTRRPRARPTRASPGAGGCIRARARAGAGAAKREQRLRDVERQRVEREQAVLEVEPEVARDLVVARAAGVEPLAHAGQPPREPVLHRRVHVLLRPRATPAGRRPPPPAHARSPCRSRACSRAPRRPAARSPSMWPRLPSTSQRRRRASHGRSSPAVWSSRRAIRVPCQSPQASRAVTGRPGRGSRAPPWRRSGAPR